MSTICRLLQQCNMLAIKESSCISSTLPVFIFVRWRKPRWVPKSKSKIYRVRVPTPIDPEEDEELKRYYNSYRSKLTAIRAFSMTYIEAMAESVTEAQEIDQKEIERMFELNKMWNQEVALEREERQKQNELRQNELKKLVEQGQLEERLKLLEEAEQRIAYEKQFPFIPLEDLDKEIDRALKSRKDYEFVIDPEGNKLTKGDLIENKDNEFHSVDNR